MTLTNNIFRAYSESYFDLVNEVRRLWEAGKIELNEEDTLMVESDLGKKVMVKGQLIYLDAPFLMEEDDDQDVLEEAKHRGKNVKLNKPFRTSGGPKKFAVYVKSPSGGIKKVSFGQVGMSAKINDPKARRAFAARHDCANKKDRTKASYWSCRLPRYAKLLGLKSSFSGFW